MRFASVLGAATLAACAMFVPAAAHASDQDAQVDGNEMIFFFNSNYGGSWSDFLSQRTNLAGYKFLTNGNGKGQYVKNNAASVSSWRNAAARVHFNSGFTGAYDYVQPYEDRNLTNTYNENASFDWYPWG